MQILITGGTGFIGQLLREELIKQGHNLTIVTRNIKKYEDESASNQRFIDLNDDFVPYIEKSDAVINLAGENLFKKRWDEKLKKIIYDSRINTTRKLVEAMEKAETKPKVFISASASGYYGDKGDRILDESAEAADDFLAKICKDWETEAKKAEKLSIRVAIPRIGVVLERGGGALEKMLPIFNLFIGGPIGNGKQYLPWIHRSDLVQAIIYPLTSEQLSGPYNACAPGAVTMNELAKTLGSVMNRPSLFRVPAFALSIVLGEGAKPVLSSANMIPKKLKDSGFSFRYSDLDEALADII